VRLASGIDPRLSARPESWRPEALGCHQDLELRRLDL